MPKLSSKPVLLLLKSMGFFAAEVNLKWLNCSNYVLNKTVKKLCSCKTKSVLEEQLNYLKLWSWEANNASLNQKRMQAGAFIAIQIKCLLWSWANSLSESRIFLQFVLGFLWWLALLHLSFMDFHCHLPLWICHVTETSPALIKPPEF